MLKRQNQISNLQYEATLEETLEEDSRSFDSNKAEIYSEKTAYPDQTERNIDESEFHDDSEISETSSKSKISKSKNSKSETKSPPVAKMNPYDQEPELISLNEMSKLITNDLTIHRKDLEIEKFNRYISSRPIDVECSSHLKYLDMNFTCIQDAPIVKTESKTLFLVENNFQRYYLKIRVRMSSFELALEKSQKNKGVILSLLYHKVNHMRFAGIYKYEEIKWTLEEAILRGKLSLFDKYNYMLRVTKVALTMLRGRESQTQLLDLNLLPSNILLLSKAPYALNLVDIFWADLQEHEDLVVPDKSILSSFIDSRNRNMFILGRLFYFICFEEYLEYRQHLYVKEALDEKEEQNHLFQVDIELLKLIRMMLNFSPADRPSFEMVLNTLEGILSKQLNLKEMAAIYMKRAYLAMRHEVNFEYFARKSRSMDQSDNAGSVGSFAVAAEDEEDFDSVLFRLTAKYNDRWAKAVSERLENMSQETIKYLINKIKLLPILISTNPKDRFQMVHDINSKDLMPDSLDEENALRFLELGSLDFFENDLLDLEYIAEEMLLPTFQIKTKTQLEAKISKDFIYLKGSVGYDKLDPNRFMAVDIIDVFLIFVQKELYKIESEKGQDFDDIFTSKKNHLTSQEMEALLARKANEGSLWERLTRIDWKFLAIMILSQIMVMIFTFLFLIRQSDLNKYRKSEFNCHIIF